MEGEAWSDNGRAFALAAQELPQAFVQWQVTARLAAFDGLARGKTIRQFGVHLPVVATLRPAVQLPDELQLPDKQGAFSIHTATKGAGLTPKDEHLPNYVEILRMALGRAEGRPWDDSLAVRLAAARVLYERPEEIDRRRLGLLEIFQGATYRNILADPRVTLHYTGPGPAYPSFQINGWAEVVGPGDPRFEYLYLARQLFEHDHFHIHQPAYPFGYVVWVGEVFDKSPFHGRAGRRLARESQAARE